MSMTSRFLLSPKRILTSLSFLLLVAIPVFATTVDDVPSSEDEVSPVVVTLEVGNGQSPDSVQDEDGVETETESEESQAASDQTTSDPEEVSDPEDAIDDTDVDSDNSTTGELEDVTEDVTADQESSSTPIVTEQPISTGPHVTSTPPTIENETVEEKQEVKEEIKKEKKDRQNPDEIILLIGEEALKGEEILERVVKAGEEIEMAETEEDVYMDEPDEPFVSFTPVPTPDFVIRKVEREINYTTSPSHMCRSDASIDVSGEDSISSSLILSPNGGSTYEVEVGELPTGFTISLAEHELPYKTVDTELESKEKSLSFTIHKDAESQEGDFSVPVLYIKDGRDISVCQINIVNI